MQVYLDETREALGGLLGPGNAGSNTAEDHKTVIDRALAQIPTEYVESLEILVRADTVGDSSNKALVERWDGSSWSIQPLRGRAGERGASLSAVSCISPDACTAVGSYFKPSVSVVADASFRAGRTPMRAHAFNGKHHSTVGLGARAIRRGRPDAGAANRVDTVAQPCGIFHLLRQPVPTASATAMPICGEAADLHDIPF